MWSIVENKMTKQLESVFIVLLVIVAIVAFFWIAKNLGGGESVESEKPAVVCRPQNAPPEKQECFWTAHIHAEVGVLRSGKEVPVQFEQGELEEEHTHSEPNKIHWHGLIPVNPADKTIKDWSALRVDNLPKDLNLSFKETPNFIVNGNKVQPSYIWQDGDKIEIRYE